MDLDKESLEEAARGVAEEILRCGTPPAEGRVVKIATPEVTITVKIAPRGRQPRNKPTQCEIDIMVVIAASPGGAPMTTPQVIAEMDRRRMIGRGAGRDMDHGETTVVHALARLAKPGGPLVSSKRSPRGYRLAPRPAEADDADSDPDEAARPAILPMPSAGMFTETSAV